MIIQSALTIKKKCLRLSQSAFSNFAPYVINKIINRYLITSSFSISVYLPVFEIVKSYMLITLVSQRVTKLTCPVLDFGQNELRRSNARNVGVQNPSTVTKLLLSTQLMLTSLASSSYYRRVVNQSQTLPQLLWPLITERLVIK